MLSNQQQNKSDKILCVFVLDDVGSVISVYLSVIMPTWSAQNSFGNDYRQKLRPMWECVWVCNTEKVLSDLMSFLSFSSTARNDASHTITWHVFTKGSGDHVLQPYHSASSSLSVCFCVDLCVRAVKFLSNFIWSLI